MENAFLFIQLSVAVAGSASIEADFCSTSPGLIDVDLPRTEALKSVGTTRCPNWKRNIIEHKIDRTRVCYTAAVKIRQ